METNALREPMELSRVSEILDAAIRDVPDFPKEGILFKDITTLLRRPDVFGLALDAMHRHYAGARVDYVVGIESRGFIFGAPLAMKLGAGFVPVRKPGKLPAATHRVEYTLEYGSDALEIHRDAIEPGKRALIVDDLLATGGTAQATVQLLRTLEAEVAGAAFLVELAFLKGRERLTDCEILTLVTY